MALLSPPPSALAAPGSVRTRRPASPGGPTGPRAPLPRCPSAPGSGKRPPGLGGGTGSSRHPARDRWARARRTVPGGPRGCAWRHLSPSWLPPPAVRLPGRTSPARGALVAGPAHTDAGACVPRRPPGPAGEPGASWGRRRILCPWLTRGAASAASVTGRGRNGGGRRGLARFSSAVRKSPPKKKSLLFSVSDVAVLRSGRPAFPGRSPWLRPTMGRGRLCRSESCFPLRSPECPRHRGGNCLSPANPGSNCLASLQRGVWLAADGRPGAVTHACGLFPRVQGRGLRAGGSPVHGCRGDRPSPRPAGW